MVPTPPASRSAAPSVSESAEARGGRSARSDTVPTEHDLAQAREDSLLQLRIGRTAHYYSMILFALFFLDAALLLVLDPFGQSSTTLEGLYYLGFPLAGALLLAFFGISVKWEAYQIWPWESHFWVTVLSVPLAVFAAFLFVARLFGYGPTAGWPIVGPLLPLGLLAVSLPLVGLVLTWGEWSGRKTGAFGAALLPIALGVAFYVAPGAARASALTIVLVASGGLYLLSASLLHIISSGTQAHEREVIVSGQSRLFRFSEELREREDQMREREAHLLRREADVEVGEAAVARKLLAVEDVRSRLTQLERDLEVRAERVHQDLAGASSKIAEASAVQRELSDRETQLALREQQVERWESQRAKREEALAAGEGELVRRQLELGNLEKEILAREQALPLAEEAIRARKEELDRQEVQFHGRDHELAALAQGPPPDLGVPALPGSPDVAPAAPRPAALELDRRSVELDRRASELKQAESLRAQRESEMAARERTLASREAEAARKIEEAQALQKQYAEALTRVEARARGLEQSQAELSTKIDALARSTTALQIHEVTQRQAQGELEANRAQLEARERALAERTRELDARELEVRRTRQAANVVVQPAAPGTPMPSSITPVRVRPSPPGASGLRAGAVSSGIARLDELLQGGLEARSQLLLVGPPFIGKEVVAYSFLVDGLQRGESAILVSTGRSPPEIAQDLALIAPQFREYERSGRVYWIDASNPNAAPSQDPSGRNRLSVVKGPGDFAGILRALSSVTHRAKGGDRPERYRVVVLHLSSCIAQGDPRAAFGFVHNLTALLKQAGAPALYGMEPSSLAEGQLQSTLERMDGAIQFRQDRGRTALSIQGAGDVATREWIEYRSTHRSLALGSFSLERIR
jgi:KaiC/GvpD/RAD55 family RecA-like ATPase